MGFSDLSKIKAVFAEKMAKINSGVLDKEINKADAAIKRADAEKAAISEALTSGLTGEKPTFIGDTLEFTTKAPSAEESKQKAEDGEIKKEAPKFFAT